jgi:hypothetical protein
MTATVANQVVHEVTPVLRQTEIIEGTVDLAATEL